MVTIASALMGLAAFLISIALIRRYSNTPEITSILMSLNIGIYFLTSPTLLFADSPILFKYGSSGSYLISGRYETLITSMFLHANLMHLFLNMYALYILGKVAEISLGRTKFISLYFLSGLVGNLLSCIIDSSSVSVGASGAIMGLLGYIVAMEYRVTGRFNPSTVLLAIFVIFGGFSANVDVLAHLGGFLVGLGSGLFRAPSW
ncbi:rhomboid family intramembrane serine protease [Candidatus Korarchaeum cryptofilum]|jgi:rhomboid protease GluP|uniref:Membrane associated serine protease n=1 Tax=Korarchaeum cryptofilum (strain OPF8) TaxID=374847 RepID=B1L3D6_KORCO|nr:rhomboid family intramembrane serine protease [Candidatus Korarchaeum cryptofilum]ACB06965.1 Membrane associated serine protease [Candidatus Korarchaeum cryptofilum OPF8]